MDSFEFNKIAGAVLGSVLFMMGVGLIAEVIFHTEPPETPGYTVEVPEAAPAAAVETADAVQSVLPLLAAADIEAGQKVAKKCAACHSFELGGKNKVGPALWDIVTRPAGASEGFRYSDAMAALAAAGGRWGYEELDGFLTKAKDYLAGTTMGFAGVRKIADRANLIGYLRSLAETPADLPVMEKVDTAAETGATADAETAAETETPAATDLGTAAQ